MTEIGKLIGVNSEVRDSLICADHDDDVLLRIF